MLDIAPNSDEPAQIEILGLEPNALAEVDRLRLGLRHRNQRAFLAVVGGGVAEEQLEIRAVVLAIDIDRGQFGGEFGDWPAIRTEFDRGNPDQRKTAGGSDSIGRTGNHRNFVGVELSVVDHQRLTALNRAHKEPGDIAGNQPLHRSPETRNSGVEQDRHCHKEHQAEPDGGHKNAPIAKARGGHGENLVVGGEARVDDRSCECASEGQRELQHRHRSQRDELQ